MYNLASKFLCKKLSDNRNIFIKGHKSMRKFIIHYLITIFMLFFVIGCPKVDILFPVFVEGSINTLALEKQWWDKNVVELKVLTSEQVSIPGVKPILPARIGPCRDEDFGEATSFDIVWRIRAISEVSAQKFKVIPGIVPEGFEQIIPESKTFIPVQDKEYFILVCLEPVDDSVYSIGKMWTPYSEKQAGYVPKTLSIRGPYTHLASNIMFPEGIESFHREEIRIYAPSEMDIGVGYNLDDILSPIAVTVYVYPSTHAKLEDEFQEIIQVTISAHQGAKLIAKEQTSLNQAGKSYRGWKATLEYKGVFAHRKRDVISFIYLFNYDNWSIKYRITYPRKTSENAIKHIDNFINQFKW